MVYHVAESLMECAFLFSDVVTPEKKYCSYCLDSNWTRGVHFLLPSHSINLFFTCSNSSDSLERALQEENTTLSIFHFRHCLLDI
jgi:hypothetical protein